ncbi:sigma-70 family RNA polymerase sigma factor [Roseibacillus ishigakijimensis]|uniref:Sigma-70 family RNA polymerase sigma factor n=1 Tax=Roseibacillus ishigakijimensis TaxID=454146 RepID=A0A934VKW1_9BACT|nr:sigma-70 family RNA polymerase sigma factor [Roseibacillus ishigakijimensis]MBK1832501.1 sigma-70 family RNA polymerase sigma factor [Roseibacillus ishigakijimensis]
MSRQKEAERYVQAQFVCHQDVLKGFLSSLERDSHFVEDLLQETYLTVSRKALDFRPGSSFPKWACAIARYKWLELRRREARLPLLYTDEAVEQCIVDHFEGVGDGRVQLLESCIEKLPATMKRLVELTYGQGLKPAESARELGWNPPSVHVALSRVRASLRNCVNGKLGAGQEE